MKPLRFSSGCKLMRRKEGKGERGTGRKGDREKKHSPLTLSPSHPFPLLITLVLLLMAAMPAAGQDLPDGFDETYSMASLNPLLMLNADAVVRMEMQHFDVAGPGKATRTVRRAVTVFNADGRDASELYVFYDNRLRHLKKLRGQIRDAGGKVVRKLKKGDLEDYSAISGYSLYEDDRVRVARLYHDVYPYTVEFEYEVVYDGVISWPFWTPQDRGRPVVFSRFEIDAPAGMVVRHQARNGDLEPTVTPYKGRQRYRWQVENLPAFEPESYGPPLAEQIPSVYTAPAVFEIEGTKGDMSSWESLGHWAYSLYEGRDLLPQEALAEVRSLLDGVTDDREKVRLLYEYLQSKTRYVSIQLGLGGWQPFDATYVHDKGYGDCKALTNYMHTLLKVAGIPSHPVLIRAGHHAPEILSDFPSNQFNHVVLSVPLEADTVWLENTSQTMPFGHLSTFTEDRYALLIKPEGSHIVRTPRSRAEDNAQVRHARVKLAATGDAVADVHTRYTGNQQDRVRQALATSSGREREEWLHNHVDLPSFEVVSVDFSEAEAHAKTLSLPLTLKLPRYAARTGRRLFLQVNLMERWSDVPPSSDEERNQPIEYFPYAFIDTDTIRYELPDGFDIETMTLPVSLETSFGRYESKIVMEPDGTLAYYRRLEVTETQCPAEGYDAFRDFLRQIAQADRAQVVLVATAD